MKRDRIDDKPKEGKKVKQQNNDSNTPSPSTTSSASSSWSVAFKTGSEKLKSLSRKNYTELALEYFNEYLNGEESNLFGTYQKSVQSIKYSAKEIAQPKSGQGSILKVTKKTATTDGSKPCVETRAIKVVDKPCVGYSEAVKGARLAHPNVIKIFNISPIDFVCCIEMEFIENGSLRDLIKKKHPSPSKQYKELTTEIVKWMIFQCFEVALYMHQQGMVHSDLKPENIMIRNDNFDIAICDFGFSLQNETITDQSIGRTKGYYSFNDPDITNPKARSIHDRNFYSDLAAIGITFNELIKSYDLLTDDWDELLTSLKSTDQKRHNAFYDFSFEMISKIKYISSVWGNEKDMMTRVINDNSLKSLHYKFGDSLSKDMDFILEHQLLAQHIHPDLSSNREFMLKAVKLDYNVFVHASPELKSDKQFVIEIVTANGLALSHSYDKFKKDYSVVLPAVKQNGLALQYAHGILKRRKDLILVATQNNYNSICFADFGGMNEDEKIEAWTIVAKANPLTNYAPQLLHLLKSGISGLTEKDIQRITKQLQ